MLGLFNTPRRMEDLTLFARHLAGAMGARVPLPEILRAYVRDSEGDKMDRAVFAMASELENGLTLGEAIEQHPRIFPAPFRRLVALGEQGRSLPAIMRQTADHMEQGLRTYESFRRSAAYPLVLLVTLTMLIAFVVVTIIPKFTDIFEQLGYPLDQMSALWMGRNALLVGLQLLFLVPLAWLLAGLLGLRVWGFGTGRFWMQFPVIGPILRQAESANFANYLALLLENKVPLAEALALMSDASSIPYVRGAIDDFRRRYEAGEKLGDMIQSQPLFPASMAVMIAAAEDQGALAETLRHLGTFYHERTLHGLTLLREILDPLMLILIGLGLTAILVMLYMPLMMIPRLVGGVYMP